MHYALIIDRVKINHGKIRQYIKNSELDIKVVAAVTTAKEAQSIINDSPIDLVITEDTLPDKTGLQLFNDNLEQHPHLHMIILADYSLFNNSRDAMSGGQVDFLFKPVRKNDVIKSLIQMNHLINATKERKYKQERLRDDYEMSKDVFKDRFLINLIHGHIKNEVHILEQLDYFSITHSKSYVVGVMKINQYRKYQLALDEEEKQFLIFNAQDVIKSYLDTHNLGFCFINRHDEVCFILTSKMTSDALMDHCYDLLQRLYDSAHIRGTIGIGNTYERASFISVSYYQARAALGHSYYLGDSSVIHINYVAKDTTLAYNYPRNLEHQMIEMTANGNIDGAKVKLNNMFETLSIVENLPENYLSLLVVDIMVSINRVSLENNMSIEGFFKNYIRLNEINDLHSVKDAYHYLENAITDICKYQTKQRTVKNEKLLDEVTYYIRTYYANRISLKRAAEYLKTTPFYLENLVFEKYEKSFFDYCMMIRLEKAKELLATTKLSTAEVASQIGFNNADYFSAIFKQHLHISPAQYRHQTRIVQDI